MRDQLIIIAAAVMAIGLGACATPRVHEENYDIKSLEQKVDESTRKLEEIYHRMSVIQFMVDSHQRTLREIERQLGMEVSPLPSSPPLEEPGPADAPGQAPDTVYFTPPERPGGDQPAPAPEQLYAQARSVYQSRDYPQALSLFKMFIEHYPDHDLADNSLYWAGECEYSLQNYAGAIFLFKEVAQKYPEGGKAPDAILKAGYAYMALDDHENARLYFQKVVKQYPFSEASVKAEEKLTQLK